MVLGALVDPFGRQHGFQDFLHDRFAQLLGADVIGMLRGQHHRFQTDRLVVLVAQGDLAFRIRAQPGQLAVLAHLSLALDQAVRQGDRRRHQHVGFVGGVAEHQSLIPGALLAFVLAIHALGNVRRLLADDVEHAAARAVEAHVRGVITDIQDGLSNQRFDIHPGRGRHLARHDHHAGFHQRLAGHAPARIGRQNGIQDGVRNLVRHFIRMAF